MGRSEKRGLIILCAVFYLTCFVSVTLLGAQTGDKSRPLIEGINNASICGVLTMFQIMSGLLMIVADWQFGANCAFGLNGVSLLLTGVAMLVKGRTSAIPGMVMLVSSLIIYHVIKRQLKSRYHEAHYDYLTDIPNRRNILAYMEQMVEKKNSFYYVYIDLDDFKHINDTYGQQVGNNVLKTVAGYWNATKRPEDVLARLSGDEFCMVLPRNLGLDMEFILKGKIHNVNQLDLPGCDSDGHRRVAVSSGIVKFPEDGNSTVELMRKASFALQKAKKEGKNRYCFHNEEIESQIRKEVEMEKTVKAGLEKQFFYAVYQPQFDAATRKLRGYETLIRFKDEKGKMVSPVDFIPIAEKHGMIYKIDTYVLNLATKTFADVVTANRDLIISVNVSAQHITQDGFVEEVRKILEKNHYPAGCLELEITEYSFIHSVDAAIYALNKLKAMGVRIALDDFGTGYASLALLPKLPFDLIKIDKSMADRIHLDDSAKRFVEQMINIGHSLHFEVLSEGIEHQEQVDILKEQGCDWIQGYIWGRPMEVEQAMEMAKTN